MEKNLNNYITTGEFSKIVGVSKHTLFHYDKIGIFSPELKGENEYRYYSVFQVEPFYVITALKELGMSLKEIKKYLDIRSPHALISLLDIQESEIDKKIEHLLAIKQLISQKSQLTKSIFRVNTQQINVNEENSEVLLITKAVNCDDDKGLAISYANHIKNCNKNKISAPVSVGQMISKKDISNKNYNTYSYFHTKIIDFYNIDSETFIKEKGKYITAYHTKGYNTIDETYNKIFDYAIKNNISLGEYFFEDVILDELSVEGYENFVIKISIMVK